MATPLYQLGSYQFGLDTAANESLERSDAYRWAPQERLTREVAYQFLGPGERKITLPGVIYPQFRGGLGQVDAMRAEADKGQPLMLTDGLGTVFGRWVILSVREVKSVFLEGGAPRKIEFNLEIAKYGEDNPGQAATPITTRFIAGILYGARSVLEPSGALAGLANSAQQLVANATGLAVSPLAQVAGFTTGQLTSVVQSVAGGNVESLLGTFGLGGAASPEWLQAGINAAGLATAFAQGRGPEAVAIAVEQLAGLGPEAGAVIQSIAGGNAPSLQSLVNAAATVTGILDVDPARTAAVRDLILGGS